MMLVIFYKCGDNKRKKEDQYISQKMYSNAKKKQETTVDFKTFDDIKSSKGINEPGITYFIS